jgi:hypothetical protein
MWRGEEPLASAFWYYAVALGLIVNVFGLFAFFAAKTAGASDGVLFLVHISPIPYNIFAGIAVWRAAGRYEGSRQMANAARVAGVGLMTAYSLL